MDDGLKSGEEVKPNGEGDGNDDNKFTPGQQKVIDDLINKKYGEAMTKAEAKSKAKMDAYEAQIEELKKDKGTPQANTPNVDITALQEGFASLRKELAQEKLKASYEGLKSIASDLDAVSGGQVATLIAPFIKYDGGKTLVLNTKGEVRYSGEGGGEMTVGEFIKEFLNDNPHLVKASKNSGAGSISAKGKGGRGEDIKALRNLPPTDRITEARKRGIN